jgi:hypothetical protein
MYTTAVKTEALNANLSLSTHFPTTKFLSLFPLHLPKGAQIFFFSFPFLLIRGRWARQATDGWTDGWIGVTYARSKEYEWKGTYVRTTSKLKKMAKIVHYFTLPSVEIKKIRI